MAAMTTTDAINNITSWLQDDSSTDGNFTMNSNNNTNMNMTTHEPVVEPGSNVRPYCEDNSFQYVCFPTYLAVFNILVRMIMTRSLAFLGVIGNIINIIVYKRQGILASSSNVSFLCLSISDLFYSFLEIVNMVSELITTYDNAYKTWPIWLQFITNIIVRRPQQYFAQVTTWITAYIAFERAICVAFPFKVKSLFKPTRSLGVNLFIYASTILLLIPKLFEYQLKLWEGYYLYAVKQEWANRDTDLVYFYVNSTTLRFMASVVIVLSNFVIFWKVNLSQKFKSQNASSASSSATTKNNHHDTSSNRVEVDENCKGDNKTNGITSSNDEQTAKSSKSDSSSKGNNKSQTSQREIKLLRMISVISLIFVTCYIPNAIFIMSNRYVTNTFHFTIFWEVVAVCQQFNAAINILVYYTMSTKYKETLGMCLGKKK